VRDLRTLLELRQAYPLSWSSDGSWLLVACDLSGTRQLYRLPLDTGELEQLTSFAEPVEGQLLPDDRLLLEIDEGGNERGQLHLDGEPLVRRPALHPPHAARLARRDAARLLDQPPQRARLRRRRPPARERGGAELRARRLVRLR
jgi:Periplasmic component of the Tol biopolymer transport system